MKILFVAPRFPLPANTGAKIRTYNLLKQAAGANEVSLITFAFEDIDERYIRHLTQYGIKISLVNAPVRNIWKKLINIAFNPVPFSIEKYYSEKMSQEIQAQLNTNQYDLVHFDHLHMGQYRDYIDGLPCVLDEHNVESMILKRCASIEKGWVKKMLFTSQAKKMQRFDSRMLKKFSKCLAVSEDDKDSLSGLSGLTEAITVIPNGVDTDYFSPRSGLHDPQSKDALVFTGSMDWLPNSDAVEYFCRDILPLIWQVKKEVEFYIVGKNPPNSIVELGKKDNRIKMIGETEDVRPYIGEAKLFVAPMRIGGGTRLKILEALSMQKVVVSTSLGAEGLDYIEDIHIVLADSPQIFAAKVISLLQDEKKAAQIGLNGRRLVCAKYDWDSIGKKLNKVYKEASNVR